jgi:D-alanyl-lipoteichoic acid acyltransferase DltB (MBOAT superfamily)
LLWGLFKKIVIADNLAPSVNEIFGNYGNYNSDVLFLGALLFSIQIYCDFSGYSDIARGVSRLFGIELLINFNFPYFSKSISEFWKKWHISLSSWFRDYLYIPMGGSRISKVVTLRNVLVVFLVSGFWHGANWTFIAWGLIHAILFLPSVFHFDIKPESITKNELIKVFISTIKILSTFFLVTLAWIFFRSPSCGDAFGYLKGMCNLEMTSELFHFLNPYDNQNLLKEYLFVFILFISEMVYLKFGKHKVLNSFLFECAFCAFLIISIILNVPLNSQNSFIYFQF